MTTIPIYKLDYRTILNIASESQRNDICLDFSSLNFVQPDGLVFLTLFLNSEMVAGLHIKATLPEIKWDEQCPLTYMNRMHFFEKANNLTISDGDESKLAELGKMQEHVSRNFTPLVDSLDKYDISENEDNLDTLIDSFVNFLQVHYSLSKTLVRLLKQLITETFLNLVEHSQPDGTVLPYYCSQIQHYPQRQGFRLAIGDLGVGIRKSLNTIHNFGSDIEALIEVVENGVSRMSNQDQERGGGIKYIFEIAEILKIGCCIRSGKGEISINPRGMITKTDGTWFPGTQLYVWK